MVNLAELKDIDAALKPAGADDEWILQSQYYEDRSRIETQKRLRDLGVGLANNPRPIEVSLLRRVIDRLAVVYDQPPTRWLTTADASRLDETDPDHIAMVHVLERAQYDLAWRRVDKMRALMRQVVVRYFPSDPLQSVVLRPFEPFNVIREPSATAPDLIEEDHRFALLLSKSDNGAETWEYWEREHDVWAMAIVDESGAMLPDQPFAMGRSVQDMRQLANPYAELPVQNVYDEYAGGRPWLSPRFSRTSFVESINAMSNDLWNLVVNQSHSDRFFKTDDPTRVPSKKGPGMAVAIPRDTDVMDLTPNPKITECQSVTDSMIKWFSVSEDLPIDEFINRQVVSGAALKASERALNARRDSQVLLLPNDERRAWDKFRAVHNVHSNGWGVGTLDESTTMEAQVGEMSSPVDMRELQEAGARGMALGSRSIIDVIMAETSSPRHTAVKIYERVTRDREQYPAPGGAPQADLQEGPRMAGVTNEEAEMDDVAAEQGKASVVDAIKDAAEPAT